MYGRRASQLVKELSCNETDQLSAFNTDIFDQVIKECDEHHLELQNMMRKIQDEGSEGQTTRIADHFGFEVLERNRYNRAEVIQGLRWKVGHILPQEIKEKLNYSEAEYFKNHSKALESYMSELELDLTVDMVPPKDPYIKVRVLNDIGHVPLGDQSSNLARHSIHFLKRTDAEQFISLGLMEELPG